MPFIQTNHLHTRSTVCNFKNTSQSRSTVEVENSQIDLRNFYKNIERHILGNTSNKVDLQGTEKKKSKTYKSSEREGGGGEREKLNMHSRVLYTGVISARL